MPDALRRQGSFRLATAKTPLHWVSRELLASRPAAFFTSTTSFHTTPSTRSFTFRAPITEAVKVKTMDLALITALAHPV